MARDRADGEGRVAGRFLLNRRDRVYLLGLLVPLVVYDLVLKGLRIVSRHEDPGLLGGLGLLRSDLFFDMGYALLWVALFAVAQRGPLRWIVAVLLHLTTVLVALVATGAHRYFETTGSTLDAETVAHALSSWKGSGAVVASAVTPLLAVGVAVVLAYAVLGPWLLTRLLARWRGWPNAGAQGARVSWLGAAGAGLAAYALFSFSTLPGGPPGFSKPFARAAFVNVAASTPAALDAPDTGPKVALSSDEKAPTAKARLLATRPERRNVVLIHLESTRAESVTPYNENLKTTPFLDDLAKRSIFAERAYVVVPHTSNALTATVCGIYPPLDPEGTDSLADRIPGRCLPKLLGDQGYRSVYFTSSVQTFERRPELVKNMGYGEFYPVETMDTKGFRQANYFGYEDDVMLKPSEEWLRSHSDQPFFATYETITPHHDYRTPQRYGIEDFAKDDTLDRYQNSVRYVDFFLKNLFDQYKRLGLYDDTIFVIYGDHGEGFGEHGLYQHDNTVYEEGLRIPLLVVDPKRFPEGGRVREPVSQLDVLPTITDLLGYEVEDAKYPGSSMLSMPTDRTLNFSCWSEETCLASLKDSEKYVYHYGNQPDEVFDLGKDPGEQKNLAEGLSKSELDDRRAALFEWRARVAATYGESDSSAR
ncbi:MAG TPA: LTA synthase family protein [Rubrobacteraceae bacterium]|nr:LTA synthase family protein [Rubrobacteraceae bacterium]